MRLIPRGSLLALLLLADVAAALAGDLEIHFLNVGQGNAAFVRGPNGTRVLIDCGEIGQGTAVVRPYLQSIGVTDLDWSVMSHWHLDHYGGMPELFNAGYKPNVAAWDVGNAYMASGSTATAYLAATSGVRAIPVKGTTIDLGGGATLQVVAVAGKTLAGDIDISGSSQVENSSSIACLIRYLDFDCYIAGDLTAGDSGTADVEGPISAWIGQVEVAQASHHGSNTSSSAAVVANLAPSLVVQSCGLDNPYFHPTKTVVNRWNSPAATRVQWCTTEGDTDNGAGSYTALDGALVVSSDGSGFRAERVNGGGLLRFATFEQPGPAPAAGSLAVSELLVDPLASADATGEWFELTGLAPSAVDLAGVKFVSGAKAFTVASHVLLAAGERLLVGTDGKPSTNGGLRPDLGAPWEDFTLPNGTSALVVQAPGGAVLETLSWGGPGIAVAPGVASERVDLLGPATAANFAPAAGPWAGGDQGTPGAANAADATEWPAMLVVPQPHIGGTASFHLTSLDEPFLYYFLGLSQGFVPGFDAFGFHVPLNVDATFLLFLGNPQFFTLLDAAGKKSIAVPVPPNPSLVGKFFFANYLTLQFETFQFVGKSQSALVFFAIGA